MTLSVRSPDELIAVIPHLLGFKPEKSLVFLPMSTELPTARVDRPTAPHDREVTWSSIRDDYGRHAQPGSSLAIVCLTADRGTATDVGHEFPARFDSIGIDTRVMLWADDTRWADLVTGDMAFQIQGAREHVAAMTVLDGRSQPATSRGSLAESLVGDREPVAKLLPETRDAVRESTSQVEGRWALARMLRFHGDGVRLSEADAARIIVAVESIPTRDILWTDINRENASSHVALWTDLTKRAPNEVRAAPASLVGFASWVSEAPWPGARSTRFPARSPTRSQGSSPPPRAACTRGSRRRPRRSPLSVTRKLSHTPVRRPSKTPLGPHSGCEVSWISCTTALPSASRSAARHGS